MQFGVQPSLSSKFFPPTLPVCRYTRAEIAAMPGKTLKLKLTPTSPHRLRRPSPIPAPRVIMELGGPPRARRIITIAAVLFGVSITDILGGRRHALLNAARGYAIIRLRDECGFSWPLIGRLLGYADHTTAFHHYRRAKT